MEIENIKLTKLKLHPDNPRQGDIGAIATSIDQNGWYGTVVAQKSTGHVLAGNHRLQAAKQLGIKEVPVYWVDVDDTTAKKILLADNRTNDLASYNDDVLSELLTDLASTDDLLGTGYDGDDLDELLGDLEMADESVEPVSVAPPVEPITQVGDVIELGRHFLMCGDSRDFISETEFDVVVTDPPYGVAYVSHKSKDGPSKPIKGDQDTGLRDDVLKMCGNVPMLVFGSWKMPRPDNTRHVLIWNKTGMGLGMGDLSLVWGPCHEEIYVIGEGWTGKRRSNVYSVDGLSPSSKERPNHPTPKPVPLMAQLIERCPKGIIFDPFAGSGSTLLACEQLNRTCHSVELDPAYCDVIVERWESLTGEKAKRL